MKLFLCIILMHLQCMSCNISDFRFEFTSKFNDEEDNTTPYTWTLGIPTLNISIFSDNFVIGSGAPQTFSITLVLKNKTKYLITLVCDLESCTENEKEGDWDLEFSWIAPKFNSTSFFPTMTADFNESIFSLSHSTQTNWGNITIHLEECKETAEDSIDEIEIIANNETASYNETRDCACKDEHAKLYYSNATKFTNKALCNAVTNWTGCEDAQCWYAPTVSDVKVQDTIIAGDAARFECNHTKGFPTNTTESFFINGWVVENDHIFTPSDHREPLHCKVNNQYTNVTNIDASSTNKILIVNFKPENLSVVYEKDEIADIFISINDTKNVTFSFHAKDVRDNVTATVHKVNGSASPILKSRRNNPETACYYFIYSLEVNNLGDYGDYVFNARTDTPFGSETKTIKILETKIKADPPVDYTIYIAVGCSLAVVLIIVLVVFLVIYRKRKGKRASDKDVKEERENPLYGSAPGPSANAEYATVDKSKKKQEKEEKVNPIYQGTSAGADADTVEEAYAAIDIKKKKKKKEKNSEGSENSAFDPEATYAAVNKPKKKKNAEPPPDVVYSAVQKKKKNDQSSDTDLHV